MMNRIKDLRIKSGYSQKQIAEMLFVNQTAVSQWERGVTTPTKDTLLKLADIFNVSIDYLLGRSSNTTEPDIVAFHKNKSGDFTEEEREEIDNFIEYIISKRNKE